MVYECLQCNAPQAPGPVVCPHCGAAFSGPVPANAAVPDGAAPITQPFAVSAASVASAAPAPNFGPLPPLEPAPDLAQRHASATPEWVMPTMPAVPDTYRAPRRSSRGLMVGGAAAAAVALAAVIYLVVSNVPSAPSPDATYTPAPASAPTSPAPSPVAAPAVMAGTGSAPNTGDPTVLPPPVGRWMDKQFDYYEFDDSGSGTRGNVASGKPAQTFSYTVEKKQLILSLQGSSTQNISFSYGPGGASLYLRQPNGHYAEFTRQG